MSEASVVVRFVVNGFTAAEESMQNAFKAVNDLGCSVWFSLDECLKVEAKDKRFIYVFDEFAGAAFCHLVSLGCRIYGPTCILHCLKDSDVLPRMPHPVYCKAMDGIVISCTNISGDCRDLLHQRVQWMMGEASKDFHERVTHLIAGQVGSKKYAVAARLGKKIMTPEWIEAVWEKCRLVFAHASDEAFATFRCPVFQGFVISVSGMDAEERQRVRNLVEQNGGRYSGEMKVNECTHLVLHTPKGQKYDYAVKWNINVVNVEWLQQSVVTGYSLDEAQFPVSNDRNQSGIRLASAKTSTPTNQMDGHISTLSNVSSIMTTHINDTALSTTRNSSCLVIDPLDTVDISSTVGQVSFLDGCKVYVDGITGARFEKVRKIINRGGGTRYNQINESVSHVVLGDVSSDIVLQLQKLNFRPHLVNVQWLVDCLKQSCRVREENYKPIELPSLQSPGPKNIRNDISSIDVTIPDCTNKNTNIDAEEMNTLLSQYQPKEDDLKGSTLGESTLMRAANMGEFDADITMDVQECVVKCDERSNMDVTSASCNDATTDGATEQQTLFRHQTFVVIGFEADEEASKFLSELITENGGVVVNRHNRTRKVIDYAVVPVFGCEVKVTVNEIVTNAWLQVCVDEGHLVPVDSCEIYQPISVLDDTRPLDGCVLSISGYSGIERDVLLQLSEHLGGICQDYFVKRANKALLPSTHLIVNSAEGSKFMAAKKWKLPSVTKHWLLECARTGRRLPEEKFEVSKQQPEMEVISDASRRTTCGMKPTDAEPAHQSMQDDGGGTSCGPNQSKSAAAIVAEEFSNNRKSSRLLKGNKAKDSAFELLPEQSDINQNPASVISKAVASVSNGRLQNSNASDNSEKNEQGENRQKNNQSTLKLETAVTDLPRTTLALKPVLKTVENLKRSEAIKTISPKVPGKVNCDGVDTPGKFLEPGKEFHPTFDLVDVMAALESPLMTPRTQHKRNTSLPLEEVFSANLAIAIKNSNAPQDAAEQNGFTQSQDVSVENRLKQDTSGPLKGVIIAVCKKLSKNQSEYNNIAVSLGADYRWMYDSSCTHFIFQGRLNDVNKEFRIARDQCKFIVSPHWLTACNEQQCRVDESVYPHTYNPTMSLNITGHKTPARPTRNSLRAHVNSPRVLVSKDAPASVVAQQHSPSAAAAIAVAAAATTENVNGQSSGTATSGATEVLTSATDDAGFESVDTTQSDEDIAMACGKIEEQDKTTNTESIVDNLKRVMQTSKTSKARAMNRHHANSSPADGGSVIGHRNLSSENLNGRDSGCAAERNSKSKGRAKHHNRQQSKAAIDHQTQPSQIVEVGWDDPFAREQREMLASELEKDSESPKRGSDVQSPSTKNAFRKQTTDSNSKIIGLVCEENISRPSVEAANQSVRPAVNTSLSVERETAKRVDGNRIVSKKSLQKPVILFSGLPQQEKEEYALIVQSLGGITLDTANYTAQCTHLIVGTPTRNEKFLSCVAAGKWVLHKSYLEEAKITRSFPSEDQYEWGGLGTESFVSALPEQFAKLARAARRWRLKLSNSNKGAFDGWCTLLLTESKREDGFRRLLEAGGATVLADKCLDDYTGVTHAFMDLSKFKAQVNLQDMMTVGVHCVKPEFIAIYLTDDPPPCPTVHYIPEVLPLFRPEESRKRKNDPKPSEATASKRLRSS